LLFDAARDAAAERKGALCMAKSEVLYEATLQDIVRRIVEVAHPDKIILFGSAARGEMGPHSDVDLLVVKRGEFDQSRLVGDIYMNLLGLNQAVDVLLVTPEQLEQYGDTHCLVIAPALREGKEVYHAGSAATG
jgi:predicted nucleotidyltransferase